MIPDLKIPQFSALLNTPPYQFDKSLKEELNSLLKALCKQKPLIKFTPLRKSVCMLCFLEISENQSSYTLPCACFQTIHVSCFKEQGPHLLLKPSSPTLKCTSCQKPLTQNDFRDAIGGIEFDKMLQQEKEKIRQFNEYEKRDKELAFKLQNEERKKHEASSMFTCNICFSEYKIEENCITLTCDHRFCSDCLCGHLKSKMTERKTKPKDLGCPSCFAAIDHNILKSVLKDDHRILEEIMMKTLSQSILAEGEVFLKCPKGNCNNVLVLDINNKEIKEHTCEICGTEFCVRGCPQPHKGQSCEQFLKWKEENDQGDQKFDLMAQQEKLRMCPKCKAWVQKIEGCNYILCRCKHEFCYVCGAHYPGHHSQCGH